MDADLYAGLVRTVRRQVPGIAVQDVEDAVQDAWLVLAEKRDQLEPGPIGGYLMRTARFKAMHTREKQRRDVSLDALIEVAGDGVGALAQPRESLESHVLLDELAADPVGSEALEAAVRGASGQVAPRGAYHRSACYTDEQVEKVRALRQQNFTFPRIEAMTGVPAGYCSMIVGRKARITRSTEGWTARKALDAIRRFHSRAGRVPRLRDADCEPTMPSPNTVKRLFGSWTEGVREAGLEPPYDDRRMRPWSDEELLTALCAWRLRSSRWPNQHDLARDVDLPSPATIRRRLGTQSPRRLAAVVLERLA